MNQDEFQAIVEQHTDFVYNVAYRMMNNAQDAQDITQETFLSAYRNWSSFRGGSSVSTWLYRIAVNACLMRLRKEKRGRASTESVSDSMDVIDRAVDPSPAGNPEGTAINSELREEMGRAIASLPPELRSAVVLRDVQELSNAEASDVLGITVSSFKARLHRGRVFLRRQLEEYRKTLR
ncbi:MAG: sigma-70 family RNA polymerase sigma factor [Chloroflexi bacterium]|nr:sigma-70 family RNA polymerase sigma factor [Chloroflexota bacterium]